MSSEVQKIPKAQKGLCILLLVFALACLALHVSHVLDERKLTRNGRTTKATVVGTEIEETSPYNPQSNQGLGQTNQTTHYAQVEYTDEAGTKHRAKVFVTEDVYGDLTAREDELSIVYAPDEPSLARWADHPQRQSGPNLFFSVYAVVALMTLGLFYYFGGGVLLGLTTTVPFEPNNP